MVKDVLTVNICSCGQQFSYSIVAVSSMSFHTFQQYCTHTPVCQYRRADSSLLVRKSEFTENLTNLLWGKVILSHLLWEEKTRKTMVMTEKACLAEVCTIDMGPTAKIYACA